MLAAERLNFKLKEAVFEVSCGEKDQKLSFFIFRFRMNTFLKAGST